MRGGGGGECLKYQRGGFEFIKIGPDLALKMQKTKHFKNSFKQLSKRRPTKITFQQKVSHYLPFISLFVLMISCTKDNNYKPTVNFWIPVFFYTIWQKVLIRIHKTRIK